MSNILRDELSPNVLDAMPFPERLAHERRLLEDLIARYPRELAPYEMLRDRLHQYSSENYRLLRNRWLKLANDNPDDPLALLLAAEVLVGSNTPEGIRLLEAAKAKAPDFPWPALHLAGIYFDGKLADPTKATENIETFFNICPASTGGFAQYLLTKASHSLQQKVAVAVAAELRGRLEKETVPERLQEYKRLWGQEFRIRPPKEHEAERAQVARDVKRLEALNPSGGSDWKALLIDGRKQSGASKETIVALEDQLIRQYPHSNEAYAIASDRWSALHKEPADPNAAASWANYENEYAEALKSWMHNYPDDLYVQRYMWFDGIHEDSSVSEKEGIAALKLYAQSVQQFLGPDAIFADFPGAARFLVERGWQPLLALDLLHQAKTSMENVLARDRDNDNLTDQDREDRKKWQAEWDFNINGLVLKAASQSGRHDEALRLRAVIETAPPPDAKLQSPYWLNRARFAALQNQTQDALAYYQLALQTRSDPPKPLHGKLRDDVTGEARALWQAQGGTPGAWDVWSRPAATAADQLADGRWEKPTKAIPSFEISDLSGETWRLKETGGKILLINVWATWCGPCLAELPLLETFYEKVKNRGDIQVLTFNIDVDLGLVAPFLKEKGYTFPVLPAYSNGVLDDFSVPQNWVVDAHGIWQWKQTGYRGGSYADFEKDMLERLESAKTTP